MSDPIHGHYRTREEVEEHKKKDPITGLFHRLEARKLMTQAEYDAMDKAVLAEMDDAVKFTEESPEPEADDLYRDVYAS